jgi:arylsulfatase
VLLITIDTLRADHLGSYGFARATSPQIDAIAAQGAVFERGIAAAPTTAPAHASILTSRYPREHSIGYLTGRTRLDGAHTLADRFAAGGYQRAAFVSNPNLRRRLGFDRGFEHYDDELRDPEANRPGQLERSAEETSARAIAWLASADAARPAFVWLHLQDPHGPYAAPAPFAGRFAPEPERGETRLPVNPNQDGRGGIPNYQARPGLALPSEYRARYADEIFYADAAVGRVVAAAEARAASRGLALLLTADHGEFMGEDDIWFAHFHNALPPLARVPFVLRAPGIPAQRRAEPASHVDVLPTLLELAGLPVPRESRGLALGPFLREGRALPERSVICDGGEELVAYREGGFVRAVELARAWTPGAALDPGWGAYRWDGANAYAQLDDEASERALVLRDFESLDHYLRHPVPMLPAEAPDPAETARLRALGYLD